MLATEMVVVVVDIDKGIIGEGDDALTRVAVDISKGAYLSHIDVPQSGKFEEHAVGRFVDTLVAADEASVEAPFATTRVHLTTTDEDLQLPFVETEDDTVDRQPDFGMFSIERSHFFLY